MLTKKQTNSYVTTITWIKLNPIERTCSHLIDEQGKAELI